MNPALKITVLLLTVLSLSSCVSLKKYKELEATRKNCEEENAELMARNMSLTTLSNEQAASLEQYKKANGQLITDTASLGKALRDLSGRFSRLESAYNILEMQNQELQRGRKSETQKILDELQAARDDIQKKEDALKKMEQQLNDKKTSLDELNRILNEREEKLRELQSILDKKDSAVRALRQKVSDALLGFENKGLTVQQKNGKVYVSMDESLLFATGSYEVSSRGVDALKRLGIVLESNVDINIMVEGHTDDVQFKGSGGAVKDNWDLSVMRATSVIKILLKNSKISPARISAAGRGEYMPVDPSKTAEARSKNRRTEIILTPKLDELFRILDSN